MRKLKYAVVFFIVFILTLISINFYSKNNNKELKGNIHIVSNGNSYEYLLYCANKFMKLNDKVQIVIDRIDDENQINKTIIEKIESTEPVVVEINRYNMEKIGLDKFTYSFNSLLDTYNKNFSSYRLQQVKSENNFIGVPLTSRPLAFYVRDDLISKYGYKAEDINTWDDVFKVGKYIYEKSNHEIRLINATGQDYNDIVDLIIMQNLGMDYTEEEIKLKVNTQIEKLKSDNILNTTEGGEFASRISSINALSEIKSIAQECEWSVGMVPAKSFGSNKFFASEGQNLVVFNDNSKNEMLINQFITYVLTNTKDALDFVENGQLFSSYLYTYKNSKIEKEINNFTTSSPLVVLENIEMKTLNIHDYDQYIKIKRDFEVENKNS